MTTESTNLPLASKDINHLTDLVGEVHILILEDAEETRLYVEQKLKTILPHAKIYATGDATEAREIVLSGRCSILVTDLRIDSHKRSTYHVTHLLRELRDKEIHLRVIVTSAYRDLAEEVQREKLADAFVPKELESDAEVVKKAGEAFKADREFRSSFANSIIALWNGLNEKNIIDREPHYAEASKIFDELYKSSEADRLPKNQSKGLWALGGLLSHISAIPSKKWCLRDLTPDAFKLIVELMLAILSPTFDYNIQGRPILNKLRAIGFEYTISIDT